MTEQHSVLCSRPAVSQPDWAGELMDKITQVLLTEFSKAHQISELPEDKQFEHFAAFLTLRRHHSRTFDTTDIVVGGPGDTSIDSIAIIVNGVLVKDVDDVTELAEKNGYIDASFIFAQADRGPSFESTKIGSFGFGVEDFFKDEPKLDRNKELGDAASLAKAIYDKGHLIKNSPTCRLYYVTTGNWIDDNNLTARRDSCIEDLVASNIFSSVDFQCYGAKEVHRFYNQTKNAVTRDFSFPERTEISAIDGVEQAFLGHISAREFLKIISDDSGDDILGSIFDENVRDWQDYNNQVNKDIRDTLQSGNHTRFVLMNNGVTIITRNLNQLGSKFTIEDFQVVNGCQTSHVIFDQRGGDMDAVSIPLRLISTQDDDLTRSITHATNRQTELKSEQLYALTDFARLLESYFSSVEEPHKLYYERRDCQYDRLPNIEKTRIVTPQSLIRAFGAMFLDEPTRVTRNYKSIRDLVGEKIFIEGDKFEPYYVASYSAYKLEFLFRNQRIGNEYKAARYHILMALRYLINPAPLPVQMNSNEIKRRCDEMTDVLFDTDKVDALLDKAAGIVRKVVGEPFDRDNIRTEPMKDSLLQELAVDMPYER